MKWVFVVEIEKTKSVSTLKKLIKEEMAPRLDHVAAADLNLWKVSIPIDDVDKKLKNIKRSRTVKSPLKLSNVFTSVEESHVHIIIQAPTSGELI